MSERMLRFSEINWSELIASTERPSELCLRKDIPVYVKVQRERQLVYHYHHKKLVFKPAENVSLLGPGWRYNHLLILKGLPFKGFHEDLLYLRIDDIALADIASSGSTVVVNFSGEGFSLPRPYRVTGKSQGGFWLKDYVKIKDSTLVKVEFDRAFLIDKQSWEFATRSAAGEVCQPDEFTCLVTVGEGELFLASTDFEAMKKEAHGGREVVPYPFEHEEKMPGIYWMFQAAYEHNYRLKGSKAAIGEWLKRNAPADTFSYKHILTATKFVRLTLHRGKGGKPRGNFNLKELNEWTSREPYEFEFCSRGLSYILAIADWWVEVVRRNPSTPKSLLAEQLVKPGGFSTTEAGHLVYLIGGSDLTPVEIALFEIYLKDLELSEAKLSKLLQL